MKITNIIGAGCIGLFALFSTGCGASIQQIAEDTLLATNVAVAAAQSAWPEIYAAIPAADQPKAQVAYNDAIDSIQTAEGLIQDALNAGNTKDLSVQIAALEDAVAKVAALIAQYEAITPKTAALAADQAKAQILSLRLQTLNKLLAQAQYVGKHGYNRQ